MSVTDLPCELLIEAFAFCAILDHFAPLTLSSVCTHWRRVVQSSPRVWQFVLLDDTRSTAVLHAQSQLWIKRSAPLNFDVHLRLQSSENILPLLSPFLPVLHRWRQLVISGEHEETVHFPDLVSRLDTLSDLSISICSVDHVDNHPSLSTFAPYSPVWPNRINMHVQLSKLPTSRDMHPLRFTSISITEHGSGTHTKASAVLSFLQACPHLQHFCLTGLIHRDDHSNEQLPVAFLPNLKSLQLRGTCLTRSILSSIDTPSLNKLYLSHLNVDFPLPGTYRDIGDSDDEANDFSQSPWSDRAIGMGLRNLISRCNPPIKKLEMDFSDMRTKDFVWVFDRLKLLEDFLIVASDMSDTVMKLLRPFGPAEDAVGVEMETNPCLSPAPTHQVRLPRLRTLDLYNCHRLSGEVIVDTLISRTKYTDRYTPEETLEEITVVDCDRFTQQHGDMLLKEIGTRVRIE
ncbi:hypothetical protein K435DRAFT_773980 [Dendrothele bispora CBS 962.96]|uniref:F-box domain-containing protein n=1 Tax=Dendrothele bispora (strain CBS 962.96) TaxID=1314807 RepID=A0A4S8MQF7_DENBC|nr:hypothetical protein K435DRAFT_773980 [Dendrothele bispora CBS 962.96]